MGRRLGTCDLCAATDVEVSVAVGTGKTYCRGVRDCKRRAGVNVDGTGLGPKRKRKLGAAAADGEPTVCSVVACELAPAEAPCELVKVEQVIGAQLIGALPVFDAARREPLTPMRHDIELRVRGWFRATPTDMGVADTRWVKLSDVLAHAADVVGPLLAAFWQPLANAAAADANASGSRGCVSRSV